LEFAARHRLWPGRGVQPAGGKVSTPRPVTGSHRAPTADAVGDLELASGSRE